MTLIKICGLTNFLDAQVAYDSGADFLGFIFYAKSPRAADPETVSRIIMALEDGENSPRGVGVFVSPAADEVKATLKQCGLKAAQIHKLNAQELSEIQLTVYGTAFAAVQPRSVDEALTALDLVNFDAGAGDPPRRPYKSPAWCPQLMIDAYHPGLHGGTGQQADPEIALRLTASVPRLMLAGGLNPDNIGEAIRAVRPWAVDVASGTESEPGKKDHGKVRAFIQAVREADKEFVP
jgi:phosphoribosylanthranilate isomerase